jgi:hypothetical protein
METGLQIVMLLSGPSKMTTGFKGFKGANIEVDFYSEKVEDVCKILLRDPQSFNLSTLCFYHSIY